MLRIATAGWTVPRAVAEHFPSEGTGLSRYAARFSAVEINSTFYRSHQLSTYQRWAETTPQGFLFAVKLPRTITHEARLVGVQSAVSAFRAEASQLGEKLGPLLVQLPPSLVFDAAIAEAFFDGLRAEWSGVIVCEPRHVSWFEPEADAMLSGYRIARVAADPARHPAASRPGGWLGFGYWRLHGSPRMYYSAYEEAALAALAAELTSALAPDVWCVFDNTTSGAAAANALRLQALVEAL